LRDNSRCPLRLPQDYLFKYGLENTNITDDGLTHLVEIPNLAELSLDNTAVTDDGLKHLQGMRGRPILIDVAGTDVTAEGAKRLHDAAPNIQVYGRTFSTPR
jgi:hypothetical protein